MANKKRIDQLERACICMIAHYGIVQKPDTSFPFAGSIDARFRKLTVRWRWVLTFAFTNTEILYVPGQTLDVWDNRKVLTLTWDDAESPMRVELYRRGKWENQLLAMARDTRDNSPVLILPQSAPLAVPYKPHSAMH